jgi:gamma-glutamyltranspeptidase/glutathione hydrolase
MLLKTANGAYRAPQTGEIMRMPTLGTTFRTLGKEGKDGFYKGRIGEAIISSTSSKGGFLRQEDLNNHAELGSEETSPISLTLNAFGINKERGGLQIWEHPPNGQGIVALMALGILQNLAQSGKLSLSSADHNSVTYLHAAIEALRIAFADANWFIADPTISKVPTSELISPQYLAERAAMFSPSAALPSDIHKGSPAFRSSDTVYFSVTDADGNAASFINSNYSGFGTAIVPPGCGFSLQCRAAGFSLEAGHPNAYGPGKRPYHTIIPALATHADNGELASVFGVMGGYMQPQGHVQVLMNQYVFGMSPQEALDAPRFLVGDGMPSADGTVSRNAVNLEEGIGQEVVDGLRKLGHNVHVVGGFDRGMFGRGQIIRVNDHGGQRVYSAGSDPRGDGCAIPLI